MFNKNLSKIQPSASMKAGLAEGGKPVTNLAIGVPDILPPDEVVNIIKNAAAAMKFSYVPSKGTRAALTNLKELVFANEDEIHPEHNLQLVSGAKYGIYLTLKTLCNDGDNVLLMQPYWLSYPEIVSSLGLSFQSWVPAVDDNGNLDFNLNELERLVREHSIKVLILNNPNNPSGKIFSKDWLLEVNAILKRYDCWLLIDEVYKELVFSKSRLSEFRINAANIVRVGSLSKSLAIPGLRVGYIAGPKALIENADLFNQHIQTCINSLSCYLVEHLSAGVYHGFAERCAGIYKERYDAIREIVKKSDLKVLHSEASFYTLVDFKQHFSFGEQACDYLSSKLNIVAVPGLPYGDHFNSYIRICLTLPVDVLAEKFSTITNSLTQ